MFVLIGYLKVKTLFTCHCLMKNLCAQWRTQNLFILGLILTGYEHKLPVRDAWRRRFAMRTSSVGLIGPSFERCWMSIAENKVEAKTTTTVAATVLAIKGPVPCFSISTPITTKFLRGFLNRRIRIKLISVNTILNKRYIISSEFLENFLFGHWETR